MLAIFDALVRNQAADSPLELSQLLTEEGGYFLSTSACQNNRPLLEVTACLID